MSDITAPISSKGQITLPKTVRDVLKLHPGDHIEFNFENDGTVRMRKKELDSNDAKIEAGRNIVQLIMETRTYPIIIQGEVSTGKTSIIAELISNHVNNKKVAIIAPTRDILERTDLLKSLETVFFNSETVTFEEILSSQPDILFIDEGQTLKDFNIVNKLLNEGMQVVVSKHQFFESDLKLIGNHFVISAARSAPGNISRIAQVAVSNSGYINSLLYSV